MEGKKLQQLLLLVCTGGAVGGGHSGAPPSTLRRAEPLVPAAPVGLGAAHPGGLLSSRARAFISTEEGGTELNSLLITLINEDGGSWALWAGNPAASRGEALASSAGSPELAGAWGAGHPKAELAGMRPGSPRRPGLPMPPNTLLGSPLGALVLGSQGVTAPHESHD